jgi:hypothetical protein
VVQRDVLHLPRARDCQDSFSGDGFVVVPDCVTRPEASPLVEAARRVAGSAVSIDHRSADAGLAYSVVSGDRIQRDAPLLFDLYTSADLLQWVRDVTGCRTVSRSPHLRSAVNLNCLTRPGEQYPLHRDAVPYTALLFLSDLDAEAGGAFVIDPPQRERVRIQPVLGCFVLMDGSRCEHGVEPLRRPALRLTMPMVFPALHVERPEGLDEYLYGA